MSFMDELITTALKDTPYASYDVEILKDGHNVVTLRLQAGLESCIARVGKQTKDSGSSLMGAYVAQGSVRAQGYTFVPAIYFFDAKKDVLIEQDCSGTPCHIDELSDIHIKTIATQLAQIHSVTQATVQQFCTKHNLALPEIQTPERSLRCYGTERFRLVEALNCDETLISWIRPRLEAAQREVSMMSVANQPHIVWGDIGGNFLVAGETVQFIDWEFANLAYGHELSYIKIHSHPTAEQFAYLVQQYATYTDLSEVQLQQEIALEERVTRLNDVIWAAMKYAEQKPGTAEAEQYYALAHKCIHLYDTIT